MSWEVLRRTAIASHFFINKINTINLKTKIMLSVTSADACARFVIISTEMTLISIFQNVFRVSCKIFRKRITIVVN